MDSPALSFDEALQDSVMREREPLAAMTRVVRAVEASFASAGAFLYRFDDDAKLELFGGGLASALAGDLWWFEDDPCQARARARTDVQLVHATQLLPRREYVASSAYREFYGRYEIDHVVCLRLNGLAHAAKGMAGVFLGRRGQDGDFEAAHKRRLLAVLSVLAELWHTHQLHARLQGVLDGIPLSFDEVEPVVVLDAFGQVLWQSAQARRLLEALSVPRRDGLRSAWRDAAQALNAGRPPSRAPRLLLEVGGGQWVSDMRPLPAAAPLFIVHMRPMQDPEAQLAARYGLTPTEAAVLACLGEGMSNAEIGAALSMSAATAATHVKRIMAKLRVDSRLRAGLIMQRAELMHGRVEPI